MNGKNILIIDEQRTARVFSALARQSGYLSDWALAGDFSHRDLSCYDLIITSFPYGRTFLNLLAEKSRWLLVLADFVCDDLVAGLASHENCYYAVKPLDCSRFGSLLKNILEEKVDR